MYMMGMIILVMSMWCGEDQTRQSLWKHFFHKHVHVSQDYYYYYFIQHNDFLKKNFIYLFIWLLWVMAHRIFNLHCGMWDLVPWPGIKPGPLHWELRVLAAGPPGKSQHNDFLTWELAGDINSKCCHRQRRTKEEKSCYDQLILLFPYPFRIQTPNLNPWK